MNYFSNSQVTRDQTISAIIRPIRRESLPDVVLAVSLFDFSNIMMILSFSPSRSSMTLWNTNYYPKKENPALSGIEEIHAGSTCNVP